MKPTSSSIPDPILHTLSALEEAHFEAYIVGGSVRDLLIGREPKDWDIATNATPEEIQKIFPESFYENTFGTVGVKIPPISPARGEMSRARDRGEGVETYNQKETREHDIVEVTTYRAESGYEDHRHPKEVRFVKTIEEDLARRDFTVNAMALAVDRKQATDSNNETQNKNTPQSQSLATNYPLPTTHCSLIDPFGGQEDIKNKVIRAVGKPGDRFGEDALRMMRAIRFLAELRTPSPLLQKKSLPGEPMVESFDIHQSSDWTTHPETLTAIQKHSSAITAISKERVRDELSRIILSKSPAQGIDMLREAQLLSHILPEVAEGIGVGQNLHHIYTVYEHNIRALATCPSQKLAVRLAALLHDVAKPRTKRGEGYRSTFYNHDHVGARMTKVLLERLRYPTPIVRHATLLVDNHLFYYNVGEVTEASVRRLVKRVGLENMRDLFNIRVADRLGSGTPKAVPYKLRHLEYMIEKVSKDPVSVKMLAVNGNILMQELGMKPGPKIGAVLDCLLAEVIEDPKRNEKSHLLDRARTLQEEQLESLRERAKDTIEARREEDDQKIKQKHWVK